MPTATTLPTWPHWWDGVPSQLSDDQARRLLNAVASRNSTMLQSLRSTFEGKGFRPARRLQRRYLLSFTSRLASAVAVWPMNGRKVAELDQDELSDILNLAKSINCWEVPTQRAFAWLKPKRDGETYRLVHSLTVIQQAADKLMTAAGRALTPKIANQFNQKGKGPKKLDEWLKATLPDAQLVLTVDVPSCFDVIRRSSLVDSLSLPKQVVKVGLFNLKDRAKRLPCILEGTTYKNPYDVGTGLNKRGVPQGSALAQLASEVEIAKLLRTVEEANQSVVAAAYGDNLIFLLKDANGLGSVRSTLASAASKIFGCDVSFELVHRIETSKPSQFRFCRRIYQFKKSQLRKRLPENFVADFALRATVAVADACAARSLDKLARCERSVIGFLRQNHEQNGVLSECVNLVCDIRDFSRLLAKKPLHGTS